MDSRLRRSRLTAPARSPMDKPGKTLCVSPTLPTARRLPTSFTAPGDKTDEFDFGERGNQQPATSLSLIPPRNPSKQPVASHGYREMKLDTLPSMVGAQSLYRKLGFEVSEPYYDTPVAGTLFMRRTLHKS